MTGIFDGLKKKMQYIFSELFQWALIAEWDLKNRITTSDDLTPAGYKMVAGTNFQT